VVTFFAFHRGTLTGNYGDQSQIKTTPPFICDAGLIDRESLGVLRCHWLLGVSDWGVPGFYSSSCKTNWTLKLYTNSKCQEQKLVLIPTLQLQLLGQETELIRFQQEETVTKLVCNIKQPYKYQQRG